MTAERVISNRCDKFDYPIVTSGADLYPGRTVRDVTDDGRDFQFGTRSRASVRVRTGIRVRTGAVPHVIPIAVQVGPDAPDEARFGSIFPPHPVALVRIRVPANQTIVTRKPAAFLRGRDTPVV